MASLMHISKKVLLTDKVDRILEDLYIKKAKLKIKMNPESKEALNQVEEDMAKKYSGDMYKIKQELDVINRKDVGWNPGYLWKLVKMMLPSPADPPMRISDILKQIFEDLPINPEYKNFLIYQEKLCNMRLAFCAEEKTYLRTMEDLNLGLENLRIPQD